MLLGRDFAGAFEMQPFIYLIVLFAVIFGWNRYIRRRKIGKYLKSFLIMIMVGMILFYIWRMVKYFPGDPPVSYYKRNLLHIFADMFCR